MFLLSWNTPPFTFRVAFLEIVILEKNPDTYCILPPVTSLLSPNVIVPPLLANTIDDVEDVSEPSLLFLNCNTGALSTVSPAGRCRCSCKTTSESSRPTYSSPSSITVLSSSVQPNTKVSLVPISNILPVNISPEAVSPRSMTTPSPDAKDACL